MYISFTSTPGDDFDADAYLRLLIAVAKSDPDNAAPEYDYVKRQADALGLDIVAFWNSTSRHYLLDRVSVSRLTALLIIKDCIMLASLDGHFSLGEKERVFTYAERLDLPRADVEAVSQWLKRYTELVADWNRLVMQDPSD